MSCKTFEVCGNSVKGAVSGLLVSCAPFDPETRCSEPVEAPTDWCPCLAVNLRDLRQGKTRAPESTIETGRLLRTKCNQCNKESI